MPVILANLLRPFVQWLVTIVVTTVIADLVADFLKMVVGAIAEHYGIPEDDAKIVVANKIIDIAALLGVGTGTLYAKLGVKAADYLGLKTASMAKRAVSSAAASKIAATDASAFTSATAGARLWSWIKKIPATPILMAGMMFQNVGDWYFFKTRLFTDTVNAIFGTDVQAANANDLPPPGFSNSDFESYAKALEANGVVGINSEQAQQTQLYSRDALKLLLTWLYGQQLSIGGSTGLKTLEAAAEKFLIRKQSTSSAAAAPKSSSPATSAPAAKTPTTPSQTQAGVIAAGALGSAQQFVDVGDGYIVSDDDLKVTAEQTLANYVATLPSQFHYEISIVNSFRSPGGFSLKGEPVQVVSSYKKDGTPRYKTIYKKFAVMRVFLYDKNGRKVQLFEDNLGQVNASEYVPSAQALAAVAGDVKASAFNTAVNVNGSTSVPASASSPAETAATQPNSGASQAAPASTPASPAPAPTPAQVSSPAPAPTPVYVPAQVAPIAQGLYQIEKSDTPEGFELIYYPPGATPNAALRYPGAPEPSTTRPTWTPPPPKPLSPVQIRVKNATTLYDVYTALGISLPPLNTRANYWQSWGLGSYSEYTGTPAQNDRMLNEIKRQAGVL